MVDETASLNIFKNVYFLNSLNLRGCSESGGEFSEGCTEAAGVELCLCNDSDLCNSTPDPKPKNTCFLLAILTAAFITMNRIQL